MTMPAAGNSASKKASTSTTETVNVASGQLLLRQNNVHIKDPEAEIRGDQLIKHAKQIVKGARYSIMPPETAEELLRISRKHESSNELTWLVNVWGILLNKSRWVEADDGMDQEAAVDWIEKAWEKDYLQCNWQGDFNVEIVPELELGDLTIKAAAETIPKLKTPRPDLTYGLEEAAFTEAERRINFAYRCRVMSNLDHAFFAVEAKSFSAPIGLAELQCARAGACMVSLTREFNEVSYTSKKAAAGKIQVPFSSTNAESQDHGDLASASTLREPFQASEISYRVDEESIAFTLAITPGKALLYVNWAEEKDFGPDKGTGVYYHMHIVGSYDLDDTARWIELRHDIDNVLDWGVGKRKRQLCSTCAKRVEGSSKKSSKRQRTG